MLLNPKIISFSRPKNMHKLDELHYVKVTHKVGCG